MERSIEKQAQEMTRAARELRRAMDRLSELHQLPNRASALTELLGSGGLSEKETERLVREAVHEVRAEIDTTRVLREPRVESRIGSAGRAFEVALDLAFMGRHQRHDWPSVPDPKDYWMLDLALAAEAEFIVTWDPHLLDHEIPLPVEIATPARFPEQLRRQEPESHQSHSPALPYSKRVDKGRYAVGEFLA